MKNLFSRLLLTIIVLAMPTMMLATVFAPFGQFEKQPWSARYFYSLISSGEQPPANWYAADFDDTVWGTVEGPLSLPEKVDSYDKLPYYATVWNANKSSYWVRRHFTVDNLDKDNYVFYVTHDDKCVAYLNGVQIYNENYRLLSPNYESRILSGNALSALKTGDNVLAVYVSDTYGGMAFMDFGLYGYEMDDILTSSVPITITNDETYPWTVCGDELTNGNVGKANSKSEIKFAYTSDKTTEFSFEWYRYNYNYHQPLQVFVDGDLYEQTSSSSYSSYTIFLPLGTHEVTFHDSIGNSSSTSNVSKLRNIRIREILPGDWLTCRLEKAGTLNVAAIDQVETLDDVELLKIVGSMNTDDWATIAYMRNLLAIDLSEAILTEIPTSAFQNNTQLSSAILPEGLTTIGNYAFQYTALKQVRIPATVKTIGSYAFYQQPLTKVEFAEDSKLESIGKSAFVNCGYIKSIIMPNTVTALGAYVFENCSRLQELWLSDALTSLPYYMAYQSDLRKLHLPKNLQQIGDHSIDRNTHLERVVFPETITSIGSYAFSGCSALDSVCLPLHLTELGSSAFYANYALTYLELPSYIASYDNNFRNCTALKKVVCRSVTPPVISSDPFQDCPAKSDITLVVPEFAMTEYGYDNYWQQFTKREAGEPVDYWMVSTKLTLENSQRMEGKPDVDINYGGQFTVNGNAPLALGQLNLYLGEANPCRLLNNCEAMGADSINTHFWVDANKWHFFTPLHDVDLTKVTMTDNPSYIFRYYDGQNRALNGATGSWKIVDDGRLNAGQGYIFQCNKSCVVTMPATVAGHAQVLNVGDVTVPLDTYEATQASNQSWNYVGNPYPTYFDIYYMDFTAPITVWNGSTYKAYSVVDDNYVLRPMQSFFVQKPAGTENIIFQKDGRQLSASVERAASRAEMQEGRHVFNLAIAADGLFDESHSDETRIVINDQASLDYEMTCDAAKFLSLQGGVPQLYTVDHQGNSYAINERPLSDGQVPLAYYADGEGFYTLRMLRTDGKVYLHDALLDTMTELSATDYTFHSDATHGVDSSRFILTFKVKSGDTTGMEEISNLKTQTLNPFDLQGRQTTASQKGIYILEGRKVVNK